LLGIMAETDIAMALKDDITKVKIFDGGAEPPSLVVMDMEDNIESLSTTNADSMSDNSQDKSKGAVPMAICGMSTRLPGGISSAEQLWEFLLNKGDACARIPAERYGTHPPSTASNDGDGATSTASDTPHWKTHGYMLDHVDLAAFDSGLFSMTRAELGIVDPQQRLLLELTR
jgi:hypothetical protein